MGPAHIHTARQNPAVDPRILFVRYAPGSCGNFVITMLQMSDQVAHWNPDVEASKHTSQFESRFLQQFKKNFTGDNHNHLKFEPHHPYKIDFFSAKMARGNDIDLEDFVRRITQNGDGLMLESWSKNQFTVLRLNKSCVPRFGEGSHIVNIMIDKASCQWLNRNRSIKLFGKEDGLWISKENHPDFLKYKYPQLPFHNQYRFEQRDFSFLRHHVVNEPVMTLFQSVDSLMEHESNATCQQSFLDLSDILDKHRFRRVLCDLYEKLGIGIINLDLADRCYDHYHETNIKPFA